MLIFSNSKSFLVWAHKEFLQLSLWQEFEGVPTYLNKNSSISSCTFVGFEFSNNTKGFF